MKTIRIVSELELDHPAASKLADAVAASVYGEAVVCLSWYDRVRDRQSPAHACECFDGTCTVPGYENYASSRGAQLRVDINEGTFIFCYRTIEEFG